MAVKFKGNGATSLVAIQNKARDDLGLSANAEIVIGATNTVLLFEGIAVTLPVGLPAIKNKPEVMKDYRGLISSMIMTPIIGVDLASKADYTAALPIVSEVDLVDLPDEQWVEHVAADLFPGTIPLYQAKDLYQAVTGTSGGSIYKSCFIGPELRVAARIKGSSISFRATTPENKCPPFHVKTVLQRLGIAQEHSDRMTGHSQMSGPYNVKTAYEYRALFGAHYAALKPWITSNFPAIHEFTEGVK